MKQFICMIALLAMVLTSQAQEIQWPESYNFNRGIEAFEKDGDYEEALYYYNKAIEEPKAKGYAFLMITYIRADKYEIGKALTAADMAIKHLPKKDKAAHAYVHTIQSGLHLEIKDTTQALAYISKAIKLTPKDEDLYDRRAQIYYEIGEYAQGDKDYQKMLSLNPGNYRALMGLGRNAKVQKQYEQAVKYFDKAIQLYPDYASGYSFRADALTQQGKFQNALHDVIEASKINKDTKAFYTIQELADTIYQPVVARLTKQTLKEPNNPYWFYVLGVVQEGTQHYWEAIDVYKQELKQGVSGNTLYRIASCYEALGDFPYAVDYLTQTIALDSTDYDLYAYRASLYNEMGETDKAIADVEYVIAHNPDDIEIMYYYKGWFLQDARRYEEAIDAYTMSLQMAEDDELFALQSRANLYRLQGKTTEAEADFRKTIAMADTLATPSEDLCMAYAWLGDSAKAVACVFKQVEHETGYSKYYNVACVYAILGDHEKAFEYVEKTLEAGCYRFYHLRNDVDLLSLDRERFEALVAEYEAKHRQELEKHHTDDTTHFEELTVEIPYTKEGGVTKVKCEINGLPLHFVFDTGASDVTISAVEASFMFKNDYLSRHDVVGSQHYMDANGDVNEGTVINLKKVYFGGLELNNIRASVVHSQRAPLLLGQSVLQKLGKIEIDNTKQLLKITYQKKSDK